MQKLASLGAQDGVPPDAVLRRVRIAFVQRATLEHRGETQDVFVIDLGLAGVFIERSAPLPIGDEVVVRFPIPGNEIPIVARCRIAWWHPSGAPLATRSLPAGIGVEFLEISDADRGRIRAHVVDYCRRNPRTRRFLRHRDPAEKEDGTP
jgi:Tfp pilus assembly protein PilZ